MTMKGKSVSDAVLARIRQRGPGWVFSPACFYDLGSREAVAVALHRLRTSDSIRRLAQGIYDVPEKHPVLGDLAPAVEGILDVCRARWGCNVMPTGAYAAHVLGLVDQVPVRLVYLTDGPSRRIEVGGMTLEFKRRSSKCFAGTFVWGNMVVQAMRYIGHAAWSSDHARELSKHLTDEDIRKMLAEVTGMPMWIRKALMEMHAHGKADAA
jgi:hypothetical protein